MVTAVFVDPVKSVATAWAGVVVDVDHHLHARQMRHQRAAEFDAVTGIDGFLAIERQTICSALKDSSVVEIMLNPGGRLFVERLASSCNAVMSVAVPAGTPMSMTVMIFTR